MKTYNQNPCPCLLGLIMNFSWALNLHEGLEGGPRKTLVMLHLKEFFLLFRMSIAYISKSGYFCKNSLSLLYWFFWWAQAMQGSRSCVLESHVVQLCYMVSRQSDSVQAVMLLCPKGHLFRWEVSTCTISQNMSVPLTRDYQALTYFGPCFRSFSCKIRKLYPYNSTSSTFQPDGFLSLSLPQTSLIPVRYRAPLWGIKHQQNILNSWICMHINKSELPPLRENPL